MNECESRLAAWCAASKFDGVWLRRRSNIAWLSGGADTHCDLHTVQGVASVVWTPARKIVLTDTIEAARLRAEEFGSEWDVRATEWWEDGAAALPPDVKDLRLTTDIPADPLYELRASLTDTEIKAARTLGHEAASGLERTMRDVRPGATEHEIAGRIAGTLRAAGIFCPVVLVAADERIARFRHPIPTERRVERTLMAAICAQRRGLIVSATRIVSLGPIGSDLRRRHDAVTRIDAALHRATRPGVAWSAALEAGLAAYDKEGFPGEWKLHHQGGPMGYECRDFKATRADTRTVFPRQLVAWNPSISGTKSEDTVLSGRNAAEAPEVLTVTGQWPPCPAEPSRGDILQIGD
ncbi:MAG: M24 family metallopeptidase [Phycisphaerae bacterium]|nr:M24 family metallopeptidase [Phycisphaerae bacterium]